MKYKEFSEKFRSIEEKVNDFQKLQNQVTTLGQTLDSKIRQNQINTQQIIDAYLQKKKDQMKLEERELAESQNQARKELEQLEEQRKQDREALAKLFSEKSTGFPWLAKAVADYFEFRDKELADFLEKKKFAAIKGAEVVRRVSAEKRDLQKQYRVAKYLLEYYENLFPWLIDFRGEDLDDLIMQILQPKNIGENSDIDEIDPVRKLITEAEDRNLTKVEKFQKALDRYWQKKKSPWEIGRDYERYVGYTYESQGYSVYYYGIEKGLEDLGRDLIAKKGREVAVIQCKHWSQHRTIHEKHICQLFGTTIRYWIENQKALRKELNIQQDLFTELIQKKRITGVFITSTSLSPTAHEFAKELGIVVKERFPFNKYPSIKCNVSYRTDEKIYHLPFDQQYDATTIEEERNERYVETVAEAEALGFRRAYRWRGNKKEN